MAKQCNTCGHRPPARRKACPQCGHEKNLNSARYCKQCGLAFDLSNVPTYLRPLLDQLIKHLPHTDQEFVDLFNKLTGRTDAGHPLPVDLVKKSTSTAEKGDPDAADAADADKPEYLICAYCGGRSAPEAERCETCDLWLERFIRRCPGCHRDMENPTANEHSCGWSQQPSDTNAGYIVCLGCGKDSIDERDDYLFALGLMITFWTHKGVKKLFFSSINKCEEIYAYLCDSRNFPDWDDDQQPWPVIEERLLQYLNHNFPCYRQGHQGQLRYCGTQQKAQELWGSINWEKVGESISNGAGIVFKLVNGAIKVTRGGK